MKIGTLQNLSIHCHIGLDPVNNSSPYHKPALEENSSASSEEGFKKNNNNNNNCIQENSKRQEEPFKRSVNFHTSHLEHKGLT